jgi:ankyrin repeat protein
MPSAHDRAAFLEPLPARPNLEMQQNRAKDLLRAAWGGDAVALGRIRALHPQPPLPEELTLSDAQLVIARGYGFQNWAVMKRKIDSLTKSPIEQFLDALYTGDVERVRALLAEHADVRAVVNEPICHFDSRPAAQAKKNLPLLDVLIAHGADLNLKSTWWAGGFGLLEYGCTPEEASPLIARGAVVDVFAAAHLGMADCVRDLVERDPSLVHARGGDGKTPLHCARTVEIARYLLDRGADVNARDVDHESRPLQYLVREVPAVGRLLVERGAWIDIFAAVGLRDAALVDRCLRDDSAALDHRTGRGLYRVAHNNDGPATPEQIGERRGDIYRWVFGHNLSAIDAAAALGYDDIVERLLRRASPAQQLLAACARADRESATALATAHPDLVRSLAPEQMRLIADRAYANDFDSVNVMIDLGFDTLARGVDRWEPLRWAAFHGNAEMVRRLLTCRAPIGLPDETYGGPPLGQCLYGALHGWSRSTGDFVGTVRLLLDSGERPDPSYLPTGRDDVDVVLREYFARQK